MKGKHDIHSNESWETFAFVDIGFRGSGADRFFYFFT